MNTKSVLDKETLDRITREALERWGAAATARHSPEEMKAAYLAACEASCTKPPPSIIVVDSPLEAWIALNAVDPPGSQPEEVWTLYWQAWACCYDIAIRAGEVPREDEQAWMELARRVGYCLTGTNAAAIAHLPTELHTDEAGLPHREDGPAIVWGIQKIYCLEGMRFRDEKVVMNPELQTIQEINGDMNVERRRIRIERFGWARYLEESKSEVVEIRKNDIEVTTEILANTPIGQRLITFCPSTGRRYALGIPGDPVSSCEEAQERLWGDKGILVIGRV